MWHKRIGKRNDCIVYHKRDACGSGGESRREWLLNSFKKAAATNSNNSKNQFWQQHNQPIEVWSPNVIQQKIDYIHQNPVKAGLVYRAEDYVYSSASNYAGIDEIIEVDCLLFGPVV